jgi:hypothetical protein
MHTVNYFDKVFTEFCYIILWEYFKLTIDYFASIILRKKITQADVVFRPQK